MKTIQERAACLADYVLENVDPADALLFRKLIIESYMAGAEEEREEFSRWHDPKTDPPQRNIDVLVKLWDTYKADKIHYSVGYINGARWFGDSIGATDDVIGWREINDD